MTGWVEVSLTLRCFATDPQEVAQFLGDTSCEIRRAGQRINQVSHAKYKDNSLRLEDRSDDPKQTSETIVQLFSRLGGIDRIRATTEKNSIKFVDLDVAIYASSNEQSDINEVFLNENVVRHIAQLSGSISFSLNTI